MAKEQKLKFKGKQVLLLGLVALVITAGYHRWTVETDKYTSVPVTGETLPSNTENSGEGQPQEEEAKPQNVNAGVAQLKQERDRARGEAMEQWQQTTKSNDASQESKSAAEKKIKNANDWSEKEKSVETLVKAKGFEDCFAHIDDSGVTVMVSGGEINGAKVAQIKDIIVDKTGADVKNIKISAE